MPKVLPLKKWIADAIVRIKKCRTALAINRDTTGLFKDGREATTLIHDAAMLVAEARAKLKIEETNFDVWMAAQRRLKRKELRKIFADAYRTWEMAPKKYEIRGPKPPTEIKETDVKDEILTSPEYSKRKEVITRLSYILEAAEKAYFKPLDTRASMIMSLNKLVNRESPE